MKVRTLAERGGSPFRPETNAVAGRFTEGGGAPFDVRYPATGEVLVTLREATDAECDHALAVARHAFDRGDWRKRKGWERAGVLEKAAHLTLARMEDLARMIVLDNGKTLPEARIDVLAASFSLKTFARYAAGEANPSPAPDGSLMKVVVREPVGVVAGLTPYNAPFPFAALKAAPALAAGNSIVLKPSERAPLLAAEFARILYEAGLPEGALSLLHGGAAVAARLAGDPRVDMITMTGGTAAGAAIMRLAAPTIKNLLLELGGKSAHIILEDADLELAVRAAAAGMFRNSGQRCFSGSRLLVQSSVAGRVEEELCALAESLVLGDPFEETTEIGAMIDDRAVEGAVDFVARARAEGLEVGAGGTRVDALNPGSFFRPTVLLGGNASCGAAQEELFGPVTTVIRVQGVEEAVEVANDTKYGLGGGVWSRDISKAMEVALRVRTGTMWVNTYGAISGDMPFGGYSQSGLGREGGQQGYEAYTEPKSILIETNPGASAPLFRNRKS
ncbi:MAG: aldehyde dehydrogenase family protein [Vicinamibacteria bacterium]|nr:aldehyde dehydrogenase family protein [Vicinamibacteria bacterium]